MAMYSLFAPYVRAMHSHVVPIHRGVHSQHIESKEPAHREYRASTEGFPGKRTVGEGRGLGHPVHTIRWWRMLRRYEYIPSSY